MDAVTPLGEGDFRPSDLLILPPQHETPVAAYVGGPKEMKLIALFCGATRLREGL